MSDTVIRDEGLTPSERRLIEQCVHGGVDTRSGMLYFCSNNFLRVTRTTLYLPTQINLIA